ncbi:MAG: LuxR family transcriptional regulator [Sneathiella sp.]|jgi:TatD DNase family protein|uniref:TatD family hydrolase n=1 Tax=Sneathiella sp. TaxID=1964365 RepID=UPI000C693414|nr:TatD family hydrolase [Sneathiella sp.]MAL79652.1 LuxR family transcriptional regulator [Sneathiella sp.]|tara:strand:+ start:321 stop:1106 length:786 start_codon:yes stop_codon:yes gene_type:complete
MLVDSHCHLNFEQLSSELDDVVARARAAGVGHMLTIGTKLREFAAVRAIAEGYDNIHCSVGVHPHEAESENDEVSTAKLIELAAHPKVVGIGETGLDYFYEHAPRELQTKSFRQHIAAARETGLPLIVHTRDADQDTIDILQDEYGKGPFTGVIHCFSSGWKVAEKSMEIGFYISISGIVTFKAAEELREHVRKIPLDRLLVETDSPYLAPVPKRGKTNEPAFVAHTAAQVAALKGVDTDRLASITTDNFFKLFNKIERKL